MNDPSAIEWWLPLALFAIATALTLVPGYLILWIGGFRRHRHWTRNARVATTVRTLLVLQPVGFLVAVLLTSVTHRLTDRLILLLAVVGAFLVSAGLLGWSMRRVQDCPEPTVRLETVRGLLLTALLRFGCFAPLLTYGLDWPTRLIASAVATASLLVCLLAFTRALQLTGLVEPLPDFLQERLRQHAPNARGVTVRTVMPNAAVLPLEQTVLFTTGALQVLDSGELEAVLFHELSHLRERKTVALLRALPRLVLVITAITVVWVPADRIAASCLVSAVAFAVAQRWLLRVRIRKEVEADAAAVAAEGSSGDYARALLKLHRAYLIPAVMKGGTHPSLYDRLEASGATPDFERPLPPVVAPAFVATLASFVIVLMIMNEWLAAW
ncbi:MAG: M48 family metalloprotease [Planctomycetes bacterium]|nr:M48 family metalloprotease [Planctomycetota bacterium]